MVGDDYVARESSHGYADISNKLLKQTQNLQSPHIKKTLQVYEKDGKVYQVQERAVGRPFGDLNESDLSQIPKEHLSDYWKVPFCILTMLFLYFYIVLINH